MASIYALKGRFQALLRPLVRRLHALGVSANQVTVAAAVVSLAVAAAVGWGAAARPWLFALLPLWMFLRMAMNAIDGMLAREFGQQSRLGAYLNELCDVVSDSALYLALFAVPGLAPAPLFVFVLLAALTEYAGVLGLMVGAPRRYDGPMGKSDRAFGIGLLGVLLAGGWIGAAITELALALMGLMCVWTVVRRVRAGLRHDAAQDSVGQRQGEQR
ncbi:inner membrane protein ynbA [Lysobacter antibioticus]|jgi:CDP-diacylglycerol--glycerol-3-phosphate 3-phosphatidyltransferase|uniref:CDP-alcohol phosphatidyltransferase family protein n=1 Tax=Lysobacter antibioticus TaxID=84531 RepID=A0A0S2DXG4_LYSAN|nr:CDP-alcohol phosphatidyltransferase family protein [Lysobacter antibioticus]ALN63121.1 inner membrane protein ynbA [Lysobacter antibioticus]ALN82429.1 CDP-alcohol phosphatidyltransferase family protein [Lysobacter antibioticus]